MTATQQSVLNSQWQLRIQNSELAAVGDVVIASSPFRIGRMPGLELTLPSCQVSSNHACIQCEGDVLTLTDLGSTNGTFVNGRQLQQSCQLKSGDLVQLADIVFRVHHKCSSSTMRTLNEQNLSDALAYVEFEKLVSGEGIVPAFQPIIEFSNQSKVGFEGLARSSFSIIDNPGSMFSIAEKLSQEVQLSEILRVAMVEKALELSGQPMIFLNSHPNEMKDLPRFVTSLESLRQAFPHAALVLEVHEHAVSDIAKMRDLSTTLGHLNIQLAYDDFGSGQARFIELVEVPPTYLKFDIRLVKGIQGSSSQHRRVVQALVRMVQDLDVVALAEGVETRDEAECCRELGFQLAQGYHFGRPAPLEHWSQ